MKLKRYILAISLIIIVSTLRINACGPYYPANPANLHFFRCCSPALEQQWQEGCRFLDYEYEQNCLLWQRITSSDIPLKDIEKVIYDASLRDFKRIPDGKLSGNKFAQWLSNPAHGEDREYVLIAKEIEEIRAYMADPWYYAYDGDVEHLRLNELMDKCKEYNGKRHAARYALQKVRLYFANNEFQNCIDLWETSVSEMPQNIVTDIIASYVGGAYLREGDRSKALELFTRSQDIGSLISLGAWDGVEETSGYKDERVKEMEYIFNRFPNSPLLSIKLQEYVRNREDFVYYVPDWDGDTPGTDDEKGFYTELVKFANKAIDSPECRQKGMWQYAVAYLFYLDNNIKKANYYLSKAEKAESAPLIEESVRAFRFLMNAEYADNTSHYRNALLRELKWLDDMMVRDVNLYADDEWQYDNKTNYSFYYWQDVARKVLLSKVCPELEKKGNMVLALQLANYATNRIYQVSPLFRAYHYGYDDPQDPESYSTILAFDEYRRTWNDMNWFDYSNQFFDWINGATAAIAAKYADRIVNPMSDLDRFLNDRSYVDSDYICDIVGTLFLREMNYEKAVQWLSKVSKNYQERTNIAKEGYFKLDPFRYQCDKKHHIVDSSDYKLRFAQEMRQLENLMYSDAEPNRKANAKIRYAIGLRNSFGKCWYLTEYGYDLGEEWGDDYRQWKWFTSNDREGFKENVHAQKAYKRVDALMAQAVSEFTDPEQAARAQLEMMNFKTLMSKYPDSKAAASVRGHCDNYHDYALHKR